MRPTAMLAATGFLGTLLLASVAFARGPHVPGEVIIRFTELPDEARLGVVESVLGQSALAGAAQWRALRHAPHAKGQPGQPHPLSYYRLLTVDPGTDVEALARRLANLPGVDYASTNAKPEPSHIPNDPMFPDQWSHTKISSAAGWDISTGDTSIIVGMVDTGCLLAHEDLQNHIWVNDDPPNGIDDDLNGFVDDTNGWDFVQNDNTLDDVFGHGTQASGLAAAQIDNGVGLAGIANLTILTAKWWHSSGTDSTVAESVFYAVDNGAHVVSMSLGCQCLLRMTEDALNYAHANNVVVVSAAGNSATSEPGYPAAYENSMAVAAIDINDQLAGFSNWGAHLDVGAPSPNVLSTGPGGVSAYVTFGGTSAAAPHVAGLAGLVLSVDPTLTNDEVRALINDNADDLGNPGFDDFFGHGRINLAATLAAIGPSCPDLDGSGAVDTADLLDLLANWGRCAGCAADLNNDGQVNTTDLLELLANWGPC